MADPTKPTPSTTTTPTPSPSPSPSSSSTTTTTNPPPSGPSNPALRMMGLPSLPRKLPSRNWLVFWAVSAALTGAIVHDRREKRRATERWRRAVAPLAAEPLPSASQLPRRLTLYIAAPPGDGLRSAQDHFIEYAKPVLAASGLDWEFVQGRRQGDVRAAVAERIRRRRRAAGEVAVVADTSSSSPPSSSEAAPPKDPATADGVVEDLRARRGLPRHEGVHGDVVVGRHAWKEYVRGLHEGWLGPLSPPAPPSSAASRDADPAKQGKDDAAAADAEKKDDDEKPKHPPQPPPYNEPRDYDAAALPPSVPETFHPSTAVPFPHRIGIRHTFVRLGWFLNRRALADEVGREMAAVCFAASRDFAGGEEKRLLEREERNWPRSVWEEEPAAREDGGGGGDDEDKKVQIGDRTWAAPLETDERIARRMRRFEMRPEDEARAREIVVPEEMVEGFFKRHARGLWRWGVGAWTARPMRPNVGSLEDVKDE